MNPVALYITLTAAFILVGVIFTIHQLRIKELSEELIDLHTQLTAVLESLAQAHGRLGHHWTAICDMQTKLRDLQQTQVGMTRNIVSLNDQLHMLTPQKRRSTRAKKRRSL